MDEQGAVVLTDGVVTLRPWRAGDAPAVFAACQDPAIQTHTHVPKPYTMADAEWFVGESAEDWETNRAASFAIVDAAGGEVLGSMTRFAPWDHRMAFGYWLAPQARGRGAATRALKLIVAWTLATTDAIRLELYTDTDNDASGRVAERAGFVREGIRRAWELDRNGEPIDAVFYVRLAEWSGRPPHDAAAGPVASPHDDHRPPGRPGTRR